jgi:hypothetical protein
MIGSMFTLAVMIMFALSGGILWELGVNYDGLAGSTVTKIHPSTYLMFATFALLVIARRNPASFVARFVTRYPGALAFLVATMLLGAYIVLGNRHGIAVIVDTYLLAVLVSVIAGEIDERDLARTEAFLHIFFIANASFGLFEYVTDHRYFPYRFDGALFEMDRRSAAFFGHPLANAVMTGTYIAILLGGGGARLPRPLRAPVVLLELAAMVPFGGRTALSLTCAMIVMWLLWQGVMVLRGRRMSLLGAAAVAIATPAAALVMGAFAVGGFFHLIAERFAHDGGSALTRLEMFEIFNSLSLRDVLVGGDYEILESIRRSRGLEWGVENPVVRLVLYQGAIFTGLLLIGFVLFMIDLSRRLRHGSAIAFFFFLFVINSFESIANKSIMLAQFVVMIQVLFRQDVARVEPVVQHRMQAAYT